MTTQVSAKTKAVLQAYEDTFANGPGFVVHEDMRQSFHDRSDADEDAELDHIPAEYRVWVRVGMRHVYLSIGRAMQLNRESVSAPDEPDTTSDRSE